jgi:hypothetical protein
VSCPDGTDRLVPRSAFGRSTVDHFIDLIHIYRAMAEALKIVAVSRDQDPKPPLCCAEQAIRDGEDSWRTRRPGLTESVISATDGGGLGIADALSVGRVGRAAGRQLLQPSFDPIKRRLHLLIGILRLGAAFMHQICG